MNSSSLLSSLKTSLGLESIHKEPLQCKLHNGFTFPIEYLPSNKIHAVPDSVASDLEYFCVDLSNNTNINANVIQRLINDPNPNPNTNHSFKTVIGEEMARIYTSDSDFLEQTQEVVLSCDSFKKKSIDSERFKEIWADIKEDAAFLEKHAFMEWRSLEDLNKSRSFLQLYSLMNIVSPIFSIILPVIMLIFPFVILKIKGISVTFEQYVYTLKDIAKSHFIGKALSIQNFSIETVLYFLFIFGIYALQMYQNIMSCIRYYNTIKRMNENICDLVIYLDDSIENMNQFIERNKDRPLYSDFCSDVYSNKLILEEILSRIGGSSLSRFCLNPRKLLDLGKMLEIYYFLYSNVEYEEGLRYSVGFNGYLDVIFGIYRNYKLGYIGKCQFCTKDAGTDSESDSSSESESKSEEQNKKTYTAFYKQYYPHHLDSSLNLVKNNIHLKKNRIITGVNASGKTTALKTTAINILVSQQFGFGFYESANVLPVHHIHSYLNIPDTSGRDSLFQAESRRCKEILDKIRASDPASRHFCLFDELYSGTNPKEATKSAISLLKFLAAKPNVRFVLTTHYVDVCNSLDKNANIENWQMNVVVNEETGRIEKYTYKMARGICTLEGGIEILKNMDYPEEILNDIEV